MSKEKSSFPQISEDTMNELSQKILNAPMQLGGTAVPFHGAIKIKIADKKAAITEDRPEKKKELKRNDEYFETLEEF